MHPLVGKGTALAAGFAESFLRKKTTTRMKTTVLKKRPVCGWHGCRYFVSTKWHQLGRRRAFLSVPRWTPLSFVETNADIKLLWSPNVASGIGIVAKEGDGDWEIIEIPEGSNVIMPLSGDEFTFPTGLAVVRINGVPQYESSHLPVVDRDGSLSRFDFVHEENASTPGSPQTVLPHFCGRNFRLKST
jgi:hypothetical protein